MSSLVEMFRERLLVALEAVSIDAQSISERMLEDEGLMASREEVRAHFITEGVRHDTDTLKGLYESLRQAETIEEMYRIVQKMIKMLQYSQDDFRQVVDECLGNVNIIFEDYNLPHVCLSTETAWAGYMGNLLRVEM